MRNKKLVADFMHKNAILLQISLIVILGLAVYANSLKGAFVWDDRLFIIDNPYINNWPKVLNIFSERVSLGGSFELYIYRPLQILTYMIDYSLWSLNVFGYHLTNVLLHILVALGVYLFVYLLCNNRLLSLFVGILFVIHPVQTDAVSYISGRGDLLSVLFMLLCLILYIRQSHPGKMSFSMFFLMLLSYILAILSKENALILPALVLLYHYSFKKKINAKLYLPVLIVAFFYMFLRMQMLGSFYHGQDILLKRVPGFFVAITNYLRILLLPINLHMDYGNRLFGITEIKALFGMAVVFLALIYAFKIRSKNKIASFSIYWFFIALLPTSSVYPITAFYMAEHWLYLPSIGFFIILASILIKSYEVKNLKVIAVSIMVCIVLVCSYLTIKQNSYWRNPVDFYKRILIYTPDSAAANNNLGYEYMTAGPKEKAIEYFEKAIKINPRMAIAYFNLGNIYIGNGDNQKAVALLTKALGIEPNSALAYYALGNAYYNLGDKEAAIRAGCKAIEIDPRYVEAYNNLASVYTEVGRVDEAIRLWNKVVELKPDFSVAHFNLAVFYYAQGKYDLSIKHCDKVIELGSQVDLEFLKLLEPHRNKIFIK